MTDYLQHARRHLPGGTDPLDLTEVAAGLTQMGGATPWLQVNTAASHGTDGATHIAAWGVGDTIVDTTDNPDGITQIVMAPASPVAYADGAYYAFDYVGDNTVAVEIISPGIYYVEARCATGRGNVSATSPFQMGLGVDARTSLTDQQVAFFSDTRLIDPDELADGGSTNTTGTELAYATVHTNSIFPVGVATKIYVSFLHEDAIAALGIVLSIFRISDNGGFTAPGTSGGGDGIQFDVDNLGDWLQVLTTGLGETITTGVATTQAGIGIVSQGGNLVIGTTAGGGGGNDDVYIDSGNDVFIRAGDDGNVFIDGHPAGTSQLYVNDFNGGITLAGGFTQLTIDGLEIDSNSGISINQTNTDDTNGITISDNGSGGINFRTGAGGDLVMQIQADGTIHALTGGSIHFDL